MLLVLLHCGSSDDEIAYSTSGDVAFASSIEGVWRSPDGLTTLTLCEDRAPSGRKCDMAVADVGHEACDDQILCHVIHRSSPGPDESFQHGKTGCGCTNTAFGSMPLRIDIAQPSGKLAVRGEANVDAYGSDGYGGQTTLDIPGELDRVLYVSMSGTIDRAAGTMHLYLGEWGEVVVAQPGVADAADDANAAPDASRPPARATKGWLDLVRTRDPNPCR
jgi:hypothetical protein